MVKDKINKKSIEYRQGLIDGYEKAVKDSEKIRKQGERNMKPIRKIIRKLREQTAK